MGAMSSKTEDENKALKVCHERKKFVKKALNGRCSLAASHVNYIQSLRNVGVSLRKFMEAEASMAESSMYTSSPPNVVPAFHDKSPSHFSSPPSQQNQAATETFSPSPLSATTTTTTTAAHPMKFGVFSSKKVEEKPFLPDADTVTPSTIPPPDPHNPSWDYFDMNDLGDSDESEGGRRSKDDPHIDDSEIRLEAHTEDEPSPPPRHSDAGSPDDFTNDNDDHRGLQGSPAREKKSPTPLQTRSPVLPPHKIEHRELVAGMREIELLFVKAADCGREVPRMLEENKFHFFRVSRDRDGDFLSLMRNACFSCGDDPSYVQEEPSADTVKYITWHRTLSSHSSSSRNPIRSNSRGSSDALNGDAFGHFGMISGSHASTLDRLYAWEKKLRDEVKASESIRWTYDRKCKQLREQESRSTSSREIDKTRAAVKDLYWRIIVAILRIRDVSKRIEELRDTELEPQLVELMEGLSQMWDGMSVLHRAQRDVVSRVQSGIPTAGAFADPESHRPTILRLESDLASLSSAFVAWTSAQREYLRSINGWLLACVSLPKKSKRRPTDPGPDDATRWMKFGPALYPTCNAWLAGLEGLPSASVADSAKALASETARLLSARSDPDTPSPDAFRLCLVAFAQHLDSFSEGSVAVYARVKEEAVQAQRNRRAWKDHLQTVKAAVAPPL